MHRPKILVTGATGRTGSAVVRQLIALGTPVRALVRSNDYRSQRLNRLGAETVVADLFDPQQLSDAMQGVSRAYYLPVWHPYMIQSAHAFALAARQAKLESIVHLSQWLAGPSHPSLESRQLHLVDELFANLPGIANTIVRPGFFADSPYMDTLPFAAHLGIFPMPVNGSGLDAPPSVEDIARVAVAALIDPQKHAGQDYRPTGPQLLSIQDMVQIIGKVFNRRVRHVPLPLWMFYKAARAQGFDRNLLTGMRHYLADHDTGAFAVGGANNVVADATGRQPEGFESITRRYAARREFQRNFTNTFATFARFMAVPFLPGLNPESFERDQSQPAAANPQLALASDYWRRARGAVAQPASPNVSNRTLELDPQTSL